MGPVCTFTLPAPPGPWKIIHKSPRCANTNAFDPTMVEAVPQDIPTHSTVWDTQGPEALPYCHRKCTTAGKPRMAEWSERCEILHQSIPTTWVPNPRKNSLWSQHTDTKTSLQLALTFSTCRDKTSESTSLQLSILNCPEPNKTNPLQHAGDWPNLFSQWPCWEIHFILGSTPMLLEWKFQPLSFCWEPQFLSRSVGARYKLMRPPCFTRKRILRPTCPRSSNTPHSNMDPFANKGLFINVSI